MKAHIGVSSAFRCLLCWCETEKPPAAVLRPRPCAVFISTFASPVTGGTLERGARTLAGWLIIMPPQSRCNVEAYTMQYRKEVYKVTVQDCSFYISVNIYLRENWTQVSNNSTKTTHLEIRWSEVGICVKRFSQCKAKYISKTIYLHKVHWVYFFAK